MYLICSTLAIAVSSVCTATYLDSHKLLDVLLVVSATVRYASPGEYAHLNVITGRLGEIVVGSRVSGRRLPAWHLVVNHLGSVQDVKICRVRVQFLSKRLASTQSTMTSLVSLTSPSIL